jgi:cyclopropane fatty-acyl-phospholipid synthase-like methyltransferase
MHPPLSPLHAHLEFLSPLSTQRAHALVQFMARYARGTVVDVGCGWAALLIQLLEMMPAIQGVGLDLSQDDLEHAQDVAAARGVADRLRLVAGDAKLNLPTAAGGVICIGASQVWGPAPEANEPMAYASALSSLRRLLVRGAPAVFGECIWSAEPTPAAAAPLAGRLDEFLALPDLLDLARDAGFAVVQVHEANLDEWDQFESGYTAAYAEWLAANEATHPEYDTVVQRLQRQRDAYYRGYQQVLGMAYLGLLAI